MNFSSKLCETITIKSLALIKPFFVLFLHKMKHLITKNGVNGNKNGSKIVKSVVEAIISRSLLSTYTWTGRSKPNATKKNALSTKLNILDLIHDVIKAYDNGYSKRDCMDDIKYKVCKYAHLG